VYHNRMARPPLTDRTQVRSSSIKVRMSTNQREKWAKAAASNGLTLSRWARMALDRAARTAI
jgi:antitoxin component of RelBE/YafQ-DinJ toxin-antitoxin module